MPLTLPNGITIKERGGVTNTRVQGLLLPIRCVHQAVYEQLLIRLRLINPMLDSGENVVIQHIIADRMGCTGTGEAAVFSIGIAVEIPMPRILVCAADDHGFSAIGAFQQPGENVRGAVSLFSVAAFDLTLHLPEYILVDDRLMRSFHPKPYVAVIPDSLLIFIGDGPESVVHAVSDVDFVFQDVPHS